MAGVVASPTEIEASNRQLIGAWSQFARSFPDGRVLEFPGLIIAFAHARINFFNAAFLWQPVDSLADLERRLRAARDYGNASGLAWFLAICDDWIPPGLRDEAGRLIETIGFRSGDAWTGMVADSLTPPALATPGLSFCPVADAATRRAVSDINCLCYDAPLQWGREAMDREFFWPPTTFGSVAYLAREAVATATTLVVDDSLYVALVATAPEYRRRGYAEAVMRDSLERARAASGITHMALHATAPGFPLYRRMGFRPVTAFSMYAMRR